MDHQNAIGSEKTARSAPGGTGFSAPGVFSFIPKTETIHHDRPNPWIRPTLTPPGPVDAVIFDVDGVLFETSASFDAAVKATTHDLLTQIYRHDRAPSR